MLNLSLLNKKFLYLGLQKVSDNLQLELQKYYFKGYLWLVNCNSYTVNVVNFAGGKFHENVEKTFHVGVFFMILLLYPS